MYTPFFLQVVFPYFEKLKIIKNRKEGKSPKRNIKGFRKRYTPKEKEIKIRPESEQVKMPLLFTFTARIMIMCRL